jgi:hypothetical protein
MDWGATYNRAFFLGPGLPLTLGGASGPRATAELLLTPFFFRPSDGGGIDELGVPTAAGVLEADSERFPPCELAATAMVSEVAGEAISLKGDSSFTRASDPNLARLLGESLRVTTKGVLEDFRRTDETMAGCFADAIAIGRRWVMESVMLWRRVVGVDDEQPVAGGQRVVGLA